MLAQHLPADRNVDLRQGMTAFLFRRGDLLIAHFGTKRQQALFRRFGTEENHRNRQCGHQYRQFHGKTSSSTAFASKKSLESCDSKPLYERPTLAMRVEAGKTNTISGLCRMRADGCRSSHR